MAEFSTTVDALAYWAKQTPDKIVLVDGEKGQRCTYAELWRWSVAFSRRLQSLGVTHAPDGPGSRVIVRVGGLFETYTAAFGIFLAGGIYCPVERHMKPQKMLEMLEYYDAAVYISSEEPESDVHYVAIESVIADNEDIEEDGTPYLDPDAIAAIIFSTGTTGKAKGIMHSFRSLYHSAEIVRENHQYLHDDVFCWIQQFDRPVCYKAVFGIFHVGGTAIHVSGPIFARTLFDAFTKYSVTILHIQAIGLSMLFERAEDEFFKSAYNLRILTVIGSALPQEYKKKMMQGLPDTTLNVQYGATEITISYYEFSKEIGKPNCVGKVSPGNDVKIVNEDWTEIHASSAENMGIIAASGPSLMRGYWKAPELNQAVLKDGYIMMTDMGYFDREHNLYVVGRRDDVIVTGGYKVAPYEIEDVAMGYGGIAECAVVGVPDKLMKNIPKLYVKMNAGAEFSAKEIYTYLAARLETFKLPRQICEVEDFPRVGSNRKINRKELKNYA